MSWIQLRLAIDPAQAALYEKALLVLNALSVTFMDAEDQPIFEPQLGTTPLWNHTQLLALFDQPLDEPGLLDQLQSLTGAPLPPHEFALIEDQDWERSWMDNFHPMRFGKRLWVVPSWCEPPEPTAVNLKLDPGLAFGTGTHPTTALCMQWLDGQPLQGLRVLDFGCGSGILAAAALLLGASQAVGTDIDPQALEASRANAEVNGISEQQLALYLPQDLPQGQFDLVLANILAGPLVELAPILTRHVRPGGRLVLSGIFVEQAEQVRAAYIDAFAMDPTVQQDGWVRIVGQRR